MGLTYSILLPLTRKEQKSLNEDSVEVYTRRWPGKLATTPLDVYLLAKDPKEPVVYKVDFVEVLPAFQGIVFRDRVATRKDYLDCLRNTKSIVWRCKGIKRANVKQSDFLVLNTKKHTFEKVTLPLRDWKYVLYTKGASH